MALLSPSAVNAFQVATRHEMLLLCWRPCPFSFGWCVALVQGDSRALPAPAEAFGITECQLHGGFFNVI